jgi:hypothetical protein
MLAAWALFSPFFSPIAAPKQFWFHHVASNIDQTSADTCLQIAGVGSNGWPVVP